MGAERFAVAGASDDPEKYGHKVYAALLNRGYDVVPLNPKASTVLGHPAYPNIAALPAPVQALSIVTPPPATEKVVADALAAGVRRIWMQPGAESASAISAAEKAGATVIAGGPCILVELVKHGRR